MCYLYFARQIALNVDALRMRIQCWQTYIKVYFHNSCWQQSWL